MTDHVPLVLKQHDWPQADRSAWEALFAEGDILEGAGPCAHWSAGSRRKRKQGYGHWLSFLKRTDPAALFVEPVCRIMPARVRAFVDECAARLNPKSVANLVGDLCVIAMAMAPGEDWRWLSTAAYRLLARANRHSLPPPLPITATEIYQRSLARLAEVESDPDLPPLRQAIHFRQALMCGFLIARPVRRRALLAMRVDKHLVPVAGGFTIAFAAEDMKDKRPRSFPLPADLVGPMRRYLDVHRPTLLAGKTSAGLWINQYGEPITPDGLSRDLPNVTVRLFDVALRPHAFRHVAATSIAEFDPEHVGIIRDILGHATLDMADRHYNRATGISACDAYQSLIDEIRTTLPRKRAANTAPRRAVRPNRQQRT